MASDEDPFGGGRRGVSRKTSRGAPAGSDDDEKEPGDDRGRGRDRGGGSRGTGGRGRSASPKDRPATAGRSSSRPRRRNEDRDADTTAPPQPSVERLRWRHPDGWDTQFAASGLADSITASIQAQFRGIGRLQGYSMDGDQSASTHVGDETFTTTHQMHSEMCAIQATRQLLPASGAYGTASNPRGVRFSTDQPHCGYCTFFLSKLGLPLTAPTAGLFNLARNCDYPLPGPLIPNLAFLANVCGLSVAELVAKLNEIYVNTGAAPEAAFQVNAGVLRHVWRQVFAALNDTLPDLR